MATATVNWIPTSGGSYEIWYGKLSTVGTTSLPPTSGWNPALGNPYDSALGTAVISGLDDNTQYRIETRADCSSVDSTWNDEMGYKLICPVLTLTTNAVNAPSSFIVASLAVVNLIEFETIATSITLVIKKTDTGATVETKVLSTPYTPNFSGQVSYTFNNLLANTQYTVYLTIHDSIANQDVVCSNHSISTPAQQVTPPPTCTTPTFTVGSIQPTSVQITITSTILTGDTFDVSLDGGTTYPVVGQTTSPITISSGISPGTQYVIVVKRHCQAGGVNTSTSQTITTPNQSISGSLSMNAATSALSPQGQSAIYIIFNFSSPTPAALTFYFGSSREYNCPGCVGGKCRVSDGYDIFTLGPTDQTCPGSPTGDTSFGGHPHYPFVVSVPAGVSTYNSGTNIHTIDPAPVLPNIPWQNLNAGGGGARGFTDLYVKINGYSSAMTITNGANISGVTIHNV